VFVGYRGYEHANITALRVWLRLSYTTFKYANLIKPASAGTFDVSFDVNTGARDGADVAQVYVGSTQAKLPRPAKELKGFSKVFLRPGESKRVTVMLEPRSFTYYDVDSKQWRAAAGQFDVLVGRSSDQIELRSKIELAETLTLKR
jgi:beta-glucosidase